MQRFLTLAAVIVAAGLLLAPGFGLAGDPGEETAATATAGASAADGGGKSVQELQIPCRDERGCPDLTVDAGQIYLGYQSIETFAPTHCAVVEGLIEAGTRHLIRLSFNTPNQGEGSLQIGNPTAPENQDFYYYSNCHNHYHFEDYAHYRLWDPLGFLAWDEVRRANPSWTASHAFAQHPELLDGMVSGHKMGFCIIDLVPALPTPHGHAVPPDPFPSHGCSNQGINRGWADLYRFNLDGQWIDVTGVAPGAYILEAETNPEHRFREEDYGNNRAFLPAVVPPLQGLGAAAPVDEARRLLD